MSDELQTEAERAEAFAKAIEARKQRLRDFERKHTSVHGDHGGLHAFVSFVLSWVSLLLRPGDLREWLRAWLAQ